MKYLVRWEIDIEADNPTDAAVQAFDLMQEQDTTANFNVQVISLKANVMKNNATREELLKFSEWINKTYGTPTVPERLP